MAFAPWGPAPPLLAASSALPSAASLAPLCFPPASTAPPFAVLPPLRPSPFSRRFAVLAASSALPAASSFACRCLSRAAPSFSPLFVAPNYIVRDTKVSKLFYIASDTTNFFSLFSKNGLPHISDGQGLILCLGPCPHFGLPGTSNGQGPHHEIRPCPLARCCLSSLCIIALRIPALCIIALWITAPHP